MRWLPLLGVLSVALLVGAVMLALASRLEREIQRRLGLGSGTRCPDCLYDIANDEIEVCPECGEPSDADARVSGARGYYLMRTSAAMLWAMESFLRKPNPAVSEAIRTLRSEIEREFGFVAKCYARLGGPAVLWTSRREAVRLEKGFRYEPPTFLERKNWVAEPQPA